MQILFGARQQLASLPGAWNIYYDAMCRRLPEEPDFILAKAVKIVSAMEAATCGTEQITVAGRVGVTVISHVASAECFHCDRINLIERIPVGGLDAVV